MVVLADACYYSPLGHTEAQVVDHLRRGISGIRALDNPVVLTGAVTLPDPAHQDLRPLHPRLSSRYTRVLNQFLTTLGRMLAGRGAIDKVFLVCKRPFFSKWYDQEPFNELQFVERIFERMELALDPARLYCLQAACSTGILALNRAVRDLSFGRARRILLLGLQAELNAEKFVSFKKLGALSNQSDPELSCLPFHKDRSGLVPGEVAVALLLENRASPDSGDIVVRAGAASADAARLTDCQEDGAYLRHCLTQTLAGQSQDDLDFVCPHGTSTPLNDRVEGQVLNDFFQARRSPIEVAPLKQYLGHTLVSSGLWETVVTALLLRHNFLPPVAGPGATETYEHLRFPDALVERPLRRALKVSVGFGGINAALMVEKA